MTSKPSGDQTAVAVIVVGKVQGVWYRGWAIEEASRRGLRGWVRNRRDGTVEALFIGSAGAVEEVVAVCKRGPAAARVDAVHRSAAADDGSVGFRQRPTE